MSTLALATPSRALWIVSVASLAVAVALFFSVRVHRGALVRGPARWPAGAPARPWMFVVLLSVPAWLALQGLCGTAIALFRGPGNPGADSLQPGEAAVMATIPPLLVTLAMLGAAAAMPEPTRPRLGLEPSRFRRAIPVALVGMLMMIPAVTWMQLGWQQIYQWLDYHHPSEHELLETMARSSAGVRAALVFAAVVVAPLFEEVLFRGGVQTLFRRALGETPAGIWTAIFATSALFAVFHPVWMAPAIITVSVCLGYAYERTGNLWAAILMHAMFNAVNTLLFFFLR